jgi:hypothetical protein
MVVEEIVGITYQWNDFLEAIKQNGCRQKVTKNFKNEVLGH